MAFSTSSLTTEAGRSTTSPAAIWFARSGERRLMMPIPAINAKTAKPAKRLSPLLSSRAQRALRSWSSDPTLAAEHGEHDDDRDDHDAEDPPELEGIAARKAWQRDVHAVDPGQQRQRHERC